ncbi:hypothetical protein [Streptomyces sp. SolWspMP-sol7th]|uniref:hypothetical protein n=1 Tax=Streptomyces sp. SolWspMP-sol7th TaxID=1839776 RepID=UPI0020C8056A|nr:hypothetical protein [Streptomyces sp. SolWspMP-sol7th]
MLCPRAANRWSFSSPSALHELSSAFSAAAALLLPRTVQAAGSRGGASLAEVRE